MFDFLDLSGFWELAKERPFTAWFLAWGFWVVPYVFTLPFNFAYRVWNRWLRHRNIMMHGWATAAMLNPLRRPTS